MSTRGDISDGLYNRLKTITTANGYDTNVYEVYYDKIPMGLQLEPHELPSILMIAGLDKPTRKVKCIDSSWQFFMQLINGDVTDAVMFDFVRDVLKAIYADGPNVDRADAFKSIHPAIYDIVPVDIEPDLNMIEANRFSIVEIEIKYRTDIFNM